MGGVDPALKDMLFGGKVVVMGGDFKQILPVVPRGTRGQIVDASLKRFAVLRHRVKVRQLHENMCVQRLNFGIGRNQCCGRCPTTRSLGRLLATH
jgi:hypothetical protein